jgi:hypothetical protein
VFDGICIERTRRGKAPALIVFSAVKYRQASWEDLPCAFMRVFCAG